MLVYSNHQLEQFQILGPIVRVHWNHQKYETNDEPPRLAWVCEEAVVPLNVDRETFISLVNAEGGNGEALADEWFERDE